MKLVEIERDGVRHIWRHFPIRYYGHSVSKCCGKDTILVRSKQGGFVTRNCSSCGKFDTLPEWVFLREIDLWVACPNCRAKMKATMIDKNYGYTCERCDLGIELASLLPDWGDL